MTVPCIDDTGFAFLFGVLLGAFLAGSISWEVCTARWEQWAVEQGHAHYDAVSGELILEPREGE